MFNWINYLRGSFNWKERDVELTEDVGEEGVAGEVQEPLVLCVIPEGTDGNFQSKNYLMLLAPQLNQVCKFNRSCLQGQFSIPWHLNHLVCLAALCSSAPGRFDCSELCPVSPVGAPSSPSFCPPCHDNVSENNQFKQHISRPLHKTIELTSTRTTNLNLTLEQEQIDEVLHQKGGGNGLNRLADQSITICQNTTSWYVV